MFLLLQNSNPSPPAPVMQLDTGASGGGLSVVKMMHVHRLKNMTQNSNQSNQSQVIKSYGRSSLGEIKPSVVGDVLDQSGNVIRGTTAIAQGGTQSAIGAAQLTLPALTIAGKLGAGWATAAIPFVGPAIAAVTMGLGLMMHNKRIGKQKVAATKIVDQVEVELKKNVAGYLENRTPAAQQRATQNFQEGWDFVLENCSNPQLGTAGQRCITERQRGGQWDWFSYYLDPITNNPPTQPDPVPVRTSAGSQPAGFSNNPFEVFSGANINPNQPNLLPLALAGILAVAILTLESK
jgi:hypothetical protein